MKNEDAKEILSAYRPNGEDATDSVFEEALEQARRDPDLSAWFHAERDRDADLARAFQSLPVPEEGKRSLLAVARVKTKRKRFTFPFWQSALAACVAGALALSFFLMTSKGTAPDLVLHEVHSVGMAELVSLAYASMPLDFQGNSLPELRGWLAGRGAPAPGDLPTDFASLGALGCRVFSDERGNALSLLCLEKNGNLVHVFIAEGVSRAALAMTEKTWIAHDGWNAYRWSDEDRSYVVMSRVAQEELEALVI